MKAVQFFKDQKGAKFWTLLDSKGKKIASYDEVTGDPETELSEYLKWLSDGSYVLMARRYERGDRGSTSFPFKIESQSRTNYPNSTPNMDTTYLMQLAERFGRLEAKIEHQDKVIATLEKQLSELAQGIKDLNDDDDENDDDALDNIAKWSGKASEIASNTKSFFKS